MGQNAPQPQREGFAVTCPLAPDASRLRSGFCSSPRSFGLSFLQTPPRDDALALLLAFGSAQPGHRTCTYEVTGHARHTRANSAAAGGRPLECRVGRRVVDSTKCPLAGGRYVWKFATTSSARFLRRHGRRIRNQAIRRGQAFDATPIAA